MSAYRLVSATLGTFNFEFWRGAPPVLIGEQAATHTRPGADGVGLQKIGAWENARDATLEGWYLSKPVALAAFDILKQAQGTEFVRVIYDNVDYLAVFGHDYFVEKCNIVSATVHPRLKGPGIDLIGGCRMQIQFSLLPRKQ